MTSHRATALFCFALLSLALLASGCASTAESEDPGEPKVWMRADSTYGVQQDEAGCQAATSLPADFKMCMQEHGWRLETPPAGQ
ncbi:MAG: hypothetical protein VCB42_05060 [Myxococcota bacterium]